MESNYQYIVYIFFKVHNKFWKLIFQFIFHATNIMTLKEIRCLSLLLYAHTKENWNSKLQVDFLFLVWIFDRKSLFRVNIETEFFNKMPEIIRYFTVFSWNHLWSPSTLKTVVFRFGKKKIKWNLKNNMCKCNLP